MPTATMETLQEKVLDGHMVSRGEALELFQGSSLNELGAIADAFTHVGQIAMLRRIAGSPIRGENYFRAEIVVGRVGPEQSAPQREFD